MASRVLVLLNRFVEDGPGLSVLRQLECIVALGEMAIEVAALHGPGPLMERFEKAGIAARALGMKGIWDLPAMVRRGGFLVAGASPDIVHSHLLMPDIVARLARPAIGGPSLIASNHGLHAVWEAGPLLGCGYCAVERSTRGMVDFFVAVSDAQKREMVDHGFPAKKIRVVHNGVDTSHFRPATREERSELRARLHWTEDEIVLLCAGDLKRVKGQDVLLAALGQIAEESGTRLRAILVGEPTYKFKFPAHLRVEWQPRQRDLRPHFQGCDIYVQPSRSESFGLATAEAMACGRAVVASAAGGLVDLVEDGVSGIRVPVGDANALAKAIRRLRDDAELRKRLGAAARTRMIERFELRTCARRLLDVWREAQAGR